MSEILQRLKEQAQALSPDERLDLVGDLLANLEGPSRLNGRPKPKTGLRPFTRALSARFEYSRSAEEHDRAAT